MVNSKINIERVELILDNMKSCIASMEEVIELKDVTEGRIRDRVLESFRPEIIGFKELLGDYISHCLRTISISVSEITYMKAIETAISEKYLPADLLNFYRKVNRIRNKTAHVYKKPSIDDLIKFYINNRDNYYTTVEYIKNYLKMERNSNRTKKLEF